MTAPRDFSALIVDASSFQQGLLATLLRSSGATRIHVAQNEADAFQTLREVKADLVVIDYDIAPGGALAFCKTLRRDETLPNRAVPVIVVAAAPTKAGIEGLRAMGVDAVLAKPCSPQMMKDKVNAVLADRPFIISSDYVGPCRRRRKDADYSGPLRRQGDPGFADPAAAPYHPPAAMVEALDHLSEAAGALTSSGTVQQVVSKTMSVRAAALAVNDADIVAATQELMRYLQTLGASVRLSPQTIQINIEALRQIVSLAPHERRLRTRLVEGVKRLVSKKLHDAMALAR